MFSDQCNHNTCLGYGLMGEKIYSSGNQVNELVTKIENIEEFQNDQQNVIPMVFCIIK